MLRTILGFFFGLVALVGVAALFEPLADLKGEQWLKNIFPFELATHPLWLALVSVGAALAAWLLLRVRAAS